MTTPSDADAKAAEGFPSIACNLRSLIRQAMPGIDGRCHAAGERCECALCLADKLGRLYATERAARERAEANEATWQLRSQQLAKSLDAAESQLAAIDAYMRSKHNGYNEQSRAAMNMTEPPDTLTAIREIVEEQIDMANDAAKFERDAAESRLGKVGTDLPQRLATAIVGGCRGKWDSQELRAIIEREVSRT